MGCRSDLERASGVSPLEGLGKHLVGVVDKGQEFSAEILDGGEVAATDDLAHDDAEDDLDLIEPGRVLGGIHEANAMLQVSEQLLPSLQRRQHPAFALLA